MDEDTSLAPTDPPEAPPGLRRARRLARLMDASLGVPFTRFRFGVDALLGLAPGIGDAAGAAIAAYIVGVGVRLGVSRRTLLRMLRNIGVEAIGGSVPGVGDIFDAAYKANVKNVALIERHLELPPEPRASRLTVVAVVVAGLLILVGTAVLSLWIARELWSLLSGAPGSGLG